MQTADIDTQLTSSTSKFQAGKPIEKAQPLSAHPSQATANGDSPTRKVITQQQASNKSGSKPRSLGLNVSARPDSSPLAILFMPHGKLENVHSRSGMSTRPVKSKLGNLESASTELSHSAEATDPSHMQYLQRRASNAAKYGRAAAVAASQSKNVTIASTSPVGISSIRNTVLAVETGSSSAQPPLVETSHEADTSQHTATSHNMNSNLHHVYETVEKLSAGAAPFWDLSKFVFRCAKRPCPMRFTKWDGIAVICPRCGPFSAIRYCRKEYLWEDIKLHWLACGKYTFNVPCVPLSIPPEVLAGPPMIPFIDGWSSPERHRQAVWFSTAQKDGDYFISRTWMTRNARTPERPTYVAVARLDCLPLSNGSSRVSALGGYLFQMIRDKLNSQGLWDESIDTQVQHQLRLEIGVDMKMLWRQIGQRYACLTEWTGFPYSHCQDSTCMYERARNMGYSACGRGFERVCQYMESQYWIIRANRTTHPRTQSVEARTRGIGLLWRIGESSAAARDGMGA
ncbi:hypothetical protein N7478_006227 [Penicillium angulare]|uniref:uncharacterized protein n=1 Tax=Penicillium angulare TaxID=116970 RepID=UPI00253FCA34|nr:uncharacterized protein N7478_006227 [Penicillium angulare]KAJ5280855.1 hypothetical protein N7478_006227 [Penicillium angulare]